MKIFDVVKLLEKLDGVPAGSRGTIVELLEDECFEVNFCNMNGESVHPSITIPVWGELLEIVNHKQVVEQYPRGTDVLWMAHYRKDPDGGDMVGPSLKISGTLEQAAIEAQAFAIREGLILQCLRRRF